MAKAELEQMSIVLELMAFFFVTVDLYGRQRIIKLENRLKVINIFDAISKMLRYFTPKMKLKYKVMIVILGLVCWDFALVAANFKWTVHDVPMSASYLTYSSLAFLSILIMLGFLASVGVLFIIVLTSAALVVIKSITRLFPIEGMMMTLGAALFIASKLIAYYKVVMVA